MSHYSYDENHEHHLGYINSRQQDFSIKESYASNRQTVVGISTNVIPYLSAKQCSGFRYNGKLNKTNDK